MKTKELVFGAMIIAIVALMGAVPQLGFIQIIPGVPGITIMHIPVLIGAMTFKTRGLAIISGSAFGITSLLVALTRPSSPVDLLFQNPLVSVVPRILFALVAYYLYIILSDKIKSKYAPKLISTVVATLFHTLLVVTMLYIFGQHIFEGGLIVLIGAIVMSNGWLEIVAAAIIVPIVMSALHKAIKY